MVRAALVVVVGTAAFVVVGSAASLGTVSSSSLAAGAATVSRCDSDGVTVDYTTTGGAVTAVRVAGLADPGCEGAALRITLTDSSGNAISSAGPTTVPSDGDAVANSLSLSVSPNPAAGTVAAYHVSLTGP